MKPIRVLIMGAAGRDFHNFNTCFRDNSAYRVVAFTAAQLPFIANRRYPPELAGRLYPRGIPIYPEECLEEVLRKHRVERVVFAYSDVSHMDVMHKASRVIARGADFMFIGPQATMLKSRLPVISVCAVRTGCGKSPLTRHIAALIAEMGITPVVVRHPMPYGDLRHQAVQRFATQEDIDRAGCTLEEREEFEPLISRGITVFSGVDYRRILRRAEREGDCIIWDGGNNDFPFFRPDLEITIVDPLRAGDETTFFPGEVNMLRARVIVINKANTALPEQLERLERSVTAANPEALVIRTDSVITVDSPEAIRGKKVLVIEDGPTVTHGGLPSGAGLAAAHLFGALEAVDPRPYVIGSISETFEKYPHIGPVLPAMGYSQHQMEELAATIDRTPCDLVLSASPVDIQHLFSTVKPLHRVSYEIRETEGHPLKMLIEDFLRKALPGKECRRQ